MTWYEKIINAHLAVTDQVSHDIALKSDRYFVWGERTESGVWADNRMTISNILGYTDLFTKLEFDPWREQFEAALNDAGISWSLNSVQYEEETGFTHYEWYWEVC